MGEEGPYEKDGRSNRKETFKGNTKWKTKSTGKRSLICLIWVSMSSYKDPHSQTCTQTSINALTSERTFSVFSTSVLVFDNSSLRCLCITSTDPRETTTIYTRCPACPVDHTSDYCSGFFALLCWGCWSLIVYQMNLQREHWKGASWWIETTSCRPFANSLP